MQVWTVEVESDDRALHLVIADIPANMTTTAAGEVLYGDYAAELAMADALIVRVADWNDLSDVLTTPLRQRAPRLPLHVLYADKYAHRLSVNWNPQVPRTIAEERVAVVIDKIREAELRRLLSVSGALFRSQGGYNYRVPSGNYTRMFLRVGSMVVTQYALDCFSFWLLPYLHNCAAIVTDTWSVSPIGFNAGLRASAHDPYRAQTLQVGFMSRYHDGSPEARKEFQDVLARLDVRRGQGTLFVVSASATGRIIRDLQAGTRVAGLNEMARYVCIYKLDHAGDMPGVPVLCDLSDGVEDSNFACLKEPEDANKVIEIDAISYFPLLIEPLEIHVDKKVTDGWIELFDAYAGRGVFSVHRDDIDPREPNRPRHHGIHINVFNMMETPRFDVKLREMASVIVNSLNGRRPAAIVHPPHAAGRALARRLDAALASSGVAAMRIDEHDSLTFDDPLEGDWLRALDFDDQILIVDDVTITGARLGLYQESLRSAGFRGRIHYVVGVARPETQEEWQIRLRNLRFRREKPRHQVHFVEYLPLPGWDARSCPWCMEQRKYSSHLGDVPPEVAARSAFLQRMRGEPFTDSLFVTRDGNEVPPLTENSIFISPGGTEADVFVAVASAIHRLRIGMIEGRRLSGPQYPHVNVLAHDDAFKSTFSDPILRLSLLRSCSAPELVHPRAIEEQTRAEAARDLLRGKYAMVLLHEIAFAVGLRKLPRSVLNEDFVAKLDANAVLTSQILSADSMRRPV